MLSISPDILKQFNAIPEIKAVPPFSIRGDFRKWVRYYLDSCAKYQLPDLRSEQVRLFVKKLRGKNQTPKQQEQAAYALSLFFASQRQDLHVSSSSDEAMPLQSFPNPAASNPDCEQEAQSTVHQPVEQSLTYGPAAKELRRYHLHETHVQLGLYEAVRRAKLTKSVSPPIPSAILLLRTCFRQTMISARFRRFLVTVTSKLL